MPTLQSLNYIVDFEATSWASLTLTSEVGSHTIPWFSLVGHDLLGMLMLATDLLDAPEVHMDHLRFDHEGDLTMAVFEVQAETIQIQIYPHAILTYQGSDKEMERKLDPLTALELVQALNKLAFEAQIDRLAFARMVLACAEEVLERYGLEAYEEQYMDRFPMDELTTLAHRLKEEQP